MFGTYAYRAIRALAVLGALALSFPLGGCVESTSLAEGGVVGTGVVALAVKGTVSSFTSDSITVNGRKLATTGAVVRVDDAPAGVADLRIGMVVDVQGSVGPNGDATASSITYRADVAGVVDGIDRSAASFTLLGQTVRTDAGTVFDGGTLETLVSQYAEVSGFRIMPGELIATRIQIRASQPQGSPVTVIGTVAALDVGARSFRIGTLTVDYSAVSPAQLPAQLANGALVSVRGMQSVVVAPLVAEGVELVPDALRADGTKVEVEGVIGDFTGLASFTVNGVVVDARSATVGGGAVGALSDGMRVQIEATMRGGVAVATQVVIESVPSVEVDGLVASLDAATLGVGTQVFAVTGQTQFEDRSATGDRNLGLASLRVGDHVVVSAALLPSPVALRVVRLDVAAPPPSQPDTTYEGTISEFISVADFKVGGNRVNAASAAFINGGAADLVNGRRIEAVGRLSAGILLASKVTFEDTTSTPPPPIALTVQGTITNFVSLASFQVAGQTVNASGASLTGGSASSLGNGARVEVRGSLVNGVLIAQSVEIDALPTTPTAEVEGSITSYTSVANFVIAGQRIDASAASFSGGSAQELAVGRVAHARGPVVNGVLMATSVELEDLEEVEVEGAITQFVSAASFVVAARTVDASTASFQHGTAGQLANGVRVGVRGTLVGSVLRASLVEFK